VKVKEVTVMRRLTIKDLLATLIVAAAVVPFAGYSARGSMPFVHDPRAMATVGVVGGLLAFAVLGRKAFGTGTLPAGHGPSRSDHPRMRDRRAVRRNLMGANGCDDGRDRDHVGALAHDAGYLAPPHAARHA
jgi:hypothetical protein